MQPHERTWPAWAVDATAAALCMILLLRGRAVMHPDRLAGLAALAAFAVTVTASTVAAAARTAALRLTPLLLTLMALGMLRAGSAHVVVAAFAAAALVPVAAMWSVGRSTRWLAVALMCAACGTAVTRLIYRNPFRELHCAPACVQNPWLRVHSPDLLRNCERVLAVVTLLWATSVVLMLVRRRQVFDVGVASIVLVLAVAGAWAIRLVQQPRPTPGGAVDRGLTLALLGAVGIAAGVRSLAPLQTLAVRRRVRRFATSLSSASDMAAIAAHLRDTTGDRTIDIELGDRTSDERSAVTTVMRNGRVVATIYHAAAARGRVAAALTPATALALETQLLLRQASEQLGDLKVSRATAVLTADDARRRLERDLHDGAQQRLLVVGMRLAHAAGEGSPGGTLNVAASQVAAALIDLRRIGRGDAAIIAELGLDDAVTAVAGTSPVPMLVAFTPCADSYHECWPQEVATTAYRVVLGALAAVQSSAAKELAVEMQCLGGGKGRTVATRHDGQRTADRGADHDRVFASGGRIVRDDGREFEAWLP